MPNNKRNRQSEAGDENQDRELQPQQGSEKPTGTEQDDNPQRGENWSNYRTRELSSNEEGNDQNVSNSTDENPQDGGSWNNYRTREMGGEGSGENFYRNRERGNYDEGQVSDDSGGGSLY